MSLLKMKKIREPNCTRCGLSENAQYPCLVGKGTVPAKIMVIGETPGYNEDQEGVPFIGKAGELLTEALEQNGISRSQIYTTNVVKCHPPDSRAPVREEIKACAIYLKKELEVVNPQFVLLLGNTALGVIGHSGITKYRGQEINKDNRTYLPTLHPAAVLRNPSYDSVFRQDIAYFARIVKGKGANPQYTVDYVTNISTFKQMCMDIHKAKMIAYDFETEGFDFLSGRVWLLGIADSPTHAWILPLQHPESPFKDTIWKNLLQIVAKVMMLNSKWRVAQNAKFDNKWFKVKAGAKVQTTWDTMLASHLLDENTPNGLEYLSQSMLGLKPYKGNIVFTNKYDKKGNLIEKVSLLKDMGDYCGEDCCNTYQVALKQIPQLKDDIRLWNLYKRLILPASHALEDVELCGLHLDRDRLLERKKICEDKIVEIEDKLTSLIPSTYQRPRKYYKHPPKGKEYKQDGDKYFIELPINYRSGKQIGEILFSDEGFGLEPISYTNGGLPSTGVDDLAYLKDTVEGTAKEFIIALLEYREWTKKYSTYILAWIERTVNSDRDRLYPTFKLHGTVTGRLASENPNAQNVPRDKFIRSIISIPSGWKLIEADYSQIELRIAAFIAGEPRMLRAYQTGADLHRLTASLVMNTPLSQVTKEQRQKGKAVAFGLLYGMSAEGFRKYAKTAYGLDFTLQEAELFRKRFFESYKGLPGWHIRQKEIAERFGYVRYPDGRIRHLPDIHSQDRKVKSEAERQAINSPVQGFASNINLYSLVRLHKILDPQEAQIVLSVHDALYFYVKEDCLDKYLKIIKKVMEDREAIKKVFRVELNIPIPVDIKVGTHWGELEEISL